MYPSNAEIDLSVNNREPPTSSPTPAPMPATKADSPQSLFTIYGPGVARVSVQPYAPLLQAGIQGGWNGEKPIRVP